MSPPRGPATTPESPMKTRTQAQAPHEIPRVTALVARFETIASETMRDLPLYNPALVVEAVGFHPFGGGWAGVLITPWFMNLVYLPRDLVPLDLALIGRKVKLALPAGEREWIRSGDTAVGAFLSLSLRSPMFGLETQEAARAEAQAHLAAFLSPPEDEAAPPAGRMRVDPPRLSRRAFLGRSGA